MAKEEKGVTQAEKDEQARQADVAARAERDRATEEARRSAHAKAGKTDANLIVRGPAHA